MTPLRFVHLKKILRFFLCGTVAGFIGNDDAYCADAVEKEP